MDVICYKCQKQIDELECVFDEYNERFLCWKCLEKINNAQKRLEKWL